MEKLQQVLNVINVQIAIKLSLTIKGKKTRNTLQTDTKSY